MIVAYVLLFTFLADAQFEAHHTSVFDLGVYDQVIWNTAHGRLLTYSAEPEFGSNFLATHLQPILILLAPLYWFWDDVRVLFVAQTLALALGAIPVFALTLRRTHSHFAAMVLSASYLLLPALEAANLFDFHPETFAPALCLTIFLLLDILRPYEHGTFPQWIALWLCVLLTLALKEDMALIVATSGLYLLVMQRAWRLGVSLIAAAALWFVVGVYVVMPAYHHGQLSPFLSYYASLGDSPQSIVWSALTKPGLTGSLLLTRDNLGALLALLLPLAMLPLLDLPTFLIATPSLLLNGLSENPLMHLMEDKHYAAPIIPFAILAAIGGLAHLRTLALRARLQPAHIVRLASLLLLLSTLGYHYLRGYTPLSRLFAMPNVEVHDRVASSIEARIPVDASLVAQDRLYPDLSHRERLSYVLHTDERADFLFLDVAQRELLNTNNLHQWLQQQLTQRPDYGIVESRDGYLLLQRGAAHADLSPAFFSFARVPDAQISQAVRVTFGDELELIGFNYRAVRDQEVKLELFWRALKDSLPARDIHLYLLDLHDNVIGETRFAQPTLVWYPTSEWRTGEVVRMQANTLTWSTDALSAYRVALAVLDPADPRKNKRGLPVVTADKERLLQNGTLLRLGEFERQFGLTWLKQ